MQKLRYSISATLPVDAGRNLEALSEAMGINRSRLVVMCIHRALPLIVAERTAALQALQQATTTQVE